MKNKEYYYENSQFIIENYNKKKTFANFLPGLAGKRGIPLWAFYVNRNQLISGFGLQDKNHPINLFHSANKAYETVGRDGFRTFIKFNGKVYEPFNVNNSYQNKIIIESHKVSIEEINTEFNIKVTVGYFGLPNEELAALVRTVKIENLDLSPKKLEIIDGLSEILPAGVRNEEFKSLSNLLQSWMDVECLDEGFGFYKLRGSTGDSAVVSEVREGNFYVAFDQNNRLDLIADRDLIFGYDTSKSSPIEFLNNDINTILSKKQVNKNKVPSAFLVKEVTLDETYQFYALAGHTHALDRLRLLLDGITKVEYIQNKEEEAKNIIEVLLKDVETKTAYKEFDAYIKQNYLDNFLRGGYPIRIGKQIYHVYARKHGDLERDYNFFSLSPEYYSTGPGNFRDVCQNRRLDSLIHSEVKFFNVYQFGNLIQLDGYNPLSVNGISYRIRDKQKQNLINTHFGNNKEKLYEFFSRKFTPGDLVNFVERQEVEVLTNEDNYLAEIIDNCDMRIESNFGEGYWIDHFTYILDLVESYIAIYPDKFNDYYLNKNIFMYYQSPIKILNQNEKSLLREDGKVRQYKSLVHFNNEGDFSKINGEYYKSNLLTKLLVLALNKFSLLDPEGYGIEMEAGKPGWNDAMNGLPGLFGSGISEAIELKRILDFLHKHRITGKMSLPKEIANLYYGLVRDYAYQNRVSLREEYRKLIFDGFKGDFIELDLQEIFENVQKMSKFIGERLEKLYDEYEGIIPTYLTYEVKDYEIVKKDNSETLVKPISFSKKAISPFLEAPARLLKIDFPKDKIKKMVDKIKLSNLYDKELKQYKTSVPLDNDTFEIGRVKAFTPGWLERESNFLHMTYKYLLGLVKGGLYKEFFEELKTNLVCFMDPEIYGRSILENSSFIATSNNPNPNIHGQGFFARLSGSTVEALNIWTMMMLGKKPFALLDNTLIFYPKPIISKDFFGQNNSLSFTLLSKTQVNYLVDEVKDTYENVDNYRFELIDESNNMEVIEGKFVQGDIATQIRDGHYKKINIYLK